VVAPGTETVVHFFSEDFIQNGDEQMGMHDGHRERLRRRFRDTGLESFQEHEVLELLLFYAVPYRDTNALAHELLAAFGSLSAVCDAPLEKLTTFPGLGESGATLLNLVSPLTRRYLQSAEGTEDVLDNAERIGRFFLPRYRGLRREVAYLLCLDAKFKPVQCVRLNTGGISFAHVDLREVVQTALESGAVYTVLAHNHTSGVALPTREDQCTTRELQKRLAALDIRLLDHIVVADGDFVSMHQSGML